MAGLYVEVLGIVAIATMVVYYLPERYGRILIALLAAGCLEADGDKRG